MQVNDILRTVSDELTTIGYRVASIIKFYFTNLRNIDHPILSSELFLHPMNISDMLQ